MIEFVRAMLLLFGAFSFAPAGLGSIFFTTPTPYGVGCILSPLCGCCEDAFATYYSAYSIVALIFALFSSMAETEQYFSFESLTASSIAFFETLPLTTYFNLISV